MEWLAGMRMTTDRLNDHTADEETTSGLTAATNFTVSSFQGRKVGGITTVMCVLARNTSTVTADSAGNITDTLCATLPVGWRPQETVTTSYDKSGTADGSVTILTSGTCTLKTLSPTATIASGTSVTFFAEWISENG